MPYASNDELPDGVKNNLPAAAQTIWRKAFNSVHASTGDENKARQAGWGAVKNAGYQKGSDGNWKKFAFEPPESGDAPQGVKDILAGAYDSCRSAWVKNNPNDRENQGNKTKCAQIAWAAVENAGWKKNEKGVWKKMAETHEFDAEIFSAGTWNGDKYTADDLQNMVKNFNSLAGAIKPPVKLGHDKSKINDGAPALGWVKSLRVAGSKLIATLTDVPNLVYQAIKKGLYKRISSEIYWDLKYADKTYKRVLSAVALLGADIPAVKDLEDLQAFLTSQIQMESCGALKAYSFEAETKADVILIKEAKKKGVKPMADELKLLSDKIDALTETVNSQKEEITTLKKDKDNAEKKYSDLQNEIDAKEKDAKINSIKEFCENQVKEGKMTPAQRDLITGDNALKVYQEGAALFITFDQFQKFAELSGKKLDTGESGEHIESEEITDAVIQFTDKVQKYVDEKNVPWEEAYNKCLTLYPKLAEAYTKGGD